MLGKLEIHRYATRDFEVARRPHSINDLSQRGLSLSGVSGLNGRLSSTLPHQFTPGRPVLRGIFPLLPPLSPPLSSLTPPLSPPHSPPHSPPLSPLSPLSLPSLSHLSPLSPLPSPLSPLPSPLSPLPSPLDYAEVLHCIADFFGRLVHRHPTSRMGVVVCGPMVMADDVAYTCHYLNKVHKPQIDLHRESFEI